MNYTDNYKVDFTGTFLKSHIQFALDREVLQPGKVGLMVWQRDWSDLQYISYHDISDSQDAGFLT